MIEPDIIIECMKEGAQDYILKPFELAKVLGSLEIVLHKRQLALTMKQFQESLKGKVDRTGHGNTEAIPWLYRIAGMRTESKDKYTAGHSRRVSEFTLRYIKTNGDTG